MIEVKVKNELDLKVFINGFPNIENMTEVDYSLIINELEQCLEEYIQQKIKGNSYYPI